MAAWERCEVMDEFTILHPGGQQWNRYNLPPDLISRDEARLYAFKVK